MELKVINYEIMNVKQALCPVLSEYVLMRYVGRLAAHCPLSCFTPRCE